MMRHVLNASLCLFAPGDVDLGAHDAARTPVLATTDHFAPGEHPNEAAVLVLEAVLSLEQWKQALEVALHRTGRTLGVIGMNDLLPEAQVRFDRSRVVAEEGVPVAGYPRVLSDKVPNPEHIVATVEGKGE